MIGIRQKKAPSEMLMTEGATTNKNPPRHLYTVMGVIENVLGSILIGLFFACILYGVATLQAFMYMQMYPDDSRLVKYLVATVWVLETLHTGFCMQFMYAYVIWNFGNTEFMGGIYWSGGLTIFLAVLIQVTVQCFYIRRLWVLSNHSVAFTIPLVTLSVGMGSSACIDVIVASVLIYYLKRGRSGLRRSDNMLVWLSVYAVNTGALTSAVSVLTVVTFAVQKESLVFLALGVMQSKLYANSFLGSLNARQHIRNMLSEYPTIELSNSSQFKTTVPVLWPIACVWSDIKIF
ncbi:hypothetical protein A0H81_10650 [Grifola frondosa]|uniref:DUF6534 domain-containing protein n=1 Tax=Grifola frondosa TaxID=5627 RepID=A0A1C7LY57_GRIFR|nr:hypothetical protein A0H81_10650 [Grifola frondosa]